MNENEIIRLWKTNSKRIENTISVNSQNVRSIQKLKVNSVISSMKPSKIFTIVSGMIWVIFIDMMILELFSIKYIFFLVSGGLISLINKIAIGTYVYHLLLIEQIDNSETVLSAQEKLATLQASTLGITKLLFLQLPLFTIFHLNTGMLQSGSIGLWILQFSTTFLFTGAALWLFFSIKSENKNTRWFKFIFREKEWGSVIKAMNILDQLDELKDSKPTPE